MRLLLWAGLSLLWGQQDGEWADLLRKIEGAQSKLSGPVDRSNPEWVKNRLRQMVEVDQLVRNAEGSPAFMQKVNEKMDEVDRSNTKEMKEILRIHGWMRISVFGKQADGHAWLLVQHADHDTAFQREVLEVLSGLVEKGETQPSSYAYLWDRVARGEGKKQRYGTQGRCTGPGAWEPFEMEDPDKVDERRRQVKLGPMAEYKLVFKRRALCP